MAGFIFGGNTGETQESLRRARDALRAGSAQMPRTAGEGLMAIGNAILERQMTKRINGMTTGEGLNRFPVAPDAPSPAQQFGAKLRGWFGG